MINKTFIDKKVLIFGLGLNQGGVGCAKFFASQGAKVKVTDLKSEDVLKPSLEQLKEIHNIEYSLEGHKNEDIEWADIIIQNPSVKPGNPYMDYAKKQGKEIETDFSIFLNFANQKKIIAVTGTKGKSTTASLIYEALKEAGKKVVFAGNIGKSILDTIPYLKEDPWIVVEISSFQLQALKDKNFAPKVAVITNIYPDHLNWHSSMEEYIEAKKEIAKNQTRTDFLIIPCGDSGGRRAAKDLTTGIKSKIITSCIGDFEEEYLNIDLPLKGYAYRENYSLALTVTETLGINDKVTLKAFSAFKGGEFRMQTMGDFNGITIINDSAATNPVSIISAIEASSDKKNIILIAGGMNKGLEYHEVAAAIETAKSIKLVYFLEGDASKEIAKYIRDTAIIGGKGFYNDLVNLLKEIKKEAREGDTILFSPGATSFNLFQNEFDRGRKFNEAVQKIFNAS